MDELMAVIMTRLFVAAAAAGAATVVICFLLNALVMPFTQLKGVKKAQESGRAITATLVKAIHPNVMDVLEEGVQSSVDGIYEYTYRGRKYRFKGHYRGMPPQEETLYFRKDPSKARPAILYGKLESEWKLIFLVLIAAAFVGTFFFF